MLFSKARCHYCGTKSKHSKTTLEFQCENCEAVNYFDGKGNVVDAPATVTSRDTSIHPQTFTQALPETLNHQQKQAFCRTCTQNQLFQTEALANYLPDESHPKFHEYEKALPKYKKDLEARYPLVCKKCAPTAQSKINRADYYGMTQNAAKLCADTKRRNGQPAYRTRDDWNKMLMRRFLDLVGLVLIMGLIVQTAYHAHAILTVLSGTATTVFDFADLKILDDATDTVSAFSPSLRECAQMSLRSRFTTACHQLFGNFVPYTLAISAAGLFYSPGQRAWYHHTHRYEEVKGQKSYFYMQLMGLAIRALAYFGLSHPYATTILNNKDKMIAAHGFAILFAWIVQLIAWRGIEPVLWKLKGKIMPDPNDRDVLGQHAGPEPEHYTPKVSSEDPLRYLRRQDNGPFDINSLAPQHAKKSTPPASYYKRQQPSPPEDSDYYDDENAMETDYRPIMRSSQVSRPNLQPRRPYTSSFGFNRGMTEEVFGIQNQLREDNARKERERQQQLHYDPPQRNSSPFYGNLPPAPMSMERRLRNPVVRPLDPERVPISQQKNFMDQMRAGIKPVQFPQKGTNMEFRKSDWVLPSDVKELGLEDRFQQTFSLADPAPAGSPTKGGFFGFFGLGS